MYVCTYYSLSLSLILSLSLSKERERKRREKQHQSTIFDFLLAKGDSPATAECKSNIAKMEIT